VALIPDRHGMGTNALLVAPPNAIPFCFGEAVERRMRRPPRLPAQPIWNSMGP